MFSDLQVAGTGPTLNSPYGAQTITRADSQAARWLSSLSSTSRGTSLNLQLEVACVCVARPAIELGDLYPSRHSGCQWHRHWQTPSLSDSRADSDSSVKRRARVPSSLRGLCWQALLVLSSSSCQRHQSSLFGVPIVGLTRQRLEPSTELQRPVTVPEPE